MTANKTEKRPDRIRFAGRILFLTEDTSLIRRQLQGEDLEDELTTKLLAGDLPLMNNISTDEITPGWVCFYYDETIAERLSCQSSRSRRWAC